MWWFRRWMAILLPVWIARSLAMPVLRTCPTLLRSLMPAGARVAMEYVERGLLPTISRVDAGLVELIRSWGITVVSSASLIGALEVWDQRQRALHERAARVVDAARQLALERTAEQLRRGDRVTEAIRGGSDQCVF